MKPEDMPEWCAILKTELAHLRSENDLLRRTLQELKELVEATQQDAFESGRVDGLTKAVWIVSSRTIPPKNASYTRAIEEAVVFLKSEIERLKRGEDSANVVCTPPTSTEK